MALTRRSLPEGDQWAVTLGLGTIPGDKMDLGIVETQAAGQCE
jgi:hypothetical protein